MKVFPKLVIKFLTVLFISLAVFIIIVTISNLLKTPSLDKEWAEDSKVLPDISISENIIEIKNIRDWRYGENTILSKNYYNETFNLDNIEKLTCYLTHLGNGRGLDISFLYSNLKMDRQSQFL